MRCRRHCGPHPQTPAALKGDAAIGRHEQAAALRGSHPIAGVVRRLLDVQHLESRGAGGAPRFPRVLAAEDPFFIARHQKSAFAGVHANRRRIFPLQPGTRVLPRGAAIVADANSRRVAEVNGAGGMTIYRDILQFSHVATGQDLPLLAPFADPNQTVACRHEQRSRVGRVVIHCVDEGVIITGVPPFAGRRLQEDAAGRELRAHHVILGRYHARVQRILSRDRKRQHCQQKRPSHVGLL